MRDTRKDAEYWAAQLAQDEGRIVKAINNVQTAGDDTQIKYRSASRIINLTFTRCLALYSAGRPVEEMAELARKLLCVDYPAYLRNFPDTEYGPSRPSWVEIIRYFSLLILSAPSPDEARAFVAAYDHWDYTGEPVPGHRDHIWEAMIAYLGFGEGREPSTGVNWPEAYENLWRVIDPATEPYAREGYMKRFLEGWYKEMASELMAETNRLRPKTTFGLYVGYWCLEAAAVAVMMDIDDTSFRGHEHYPKDLADWARAQKRAKE